VVKSIFSTRILVLDDLGTAKYTEFLCSIIYEIIEDRYQNHPGGLIVTSNLSLCDLAETMGDDRVSSRLAELCRGKIFSMVGETDHRIVRP
jgi:DNA replication protein DnaC